MVTDFLSAPFLQSACAKQRLPKNVMRITPKLANLTAILSGIGEVIIVSIKNGQKVENTYSDPTNFNTTVLSDANAEIAIYGNVTSLSCSTQGLITLDVSKNTALTSLICANCELTALDLSKNTALTSLSCNNNELTVLDLSKSTALTSLTCKNNKLTALDLSKNTALTSLSCSSNPTLTSISYPATNSDVSTAIANAITAATAADGTVTTDSAGAYYSTIADAATAKGWTIAQL